MTAESRPRVYDFNQFQLTKDPRGLLGGKGAGLAEMTALGLPVPQGFTLTTEACNDYYTAGRQIPEAVWQETTDAVGRLEEKTGKKLGDPKDPLLVSVRSGAKFSMPGMMDTILNVGLNDQSVEGLAQQTDNRRFAYDSYRRLVQMYGSTVMGVDKERFDEALEQIKHEEGAQTDADLSEAALVRTTQKFKAIVQEETGREFPQDSQIQLKEATNAVFDSWHGERAKAYRQANKIPDDLGTAVNVVRMVFGNKGEQSGTGVAFTRNPSTGENKLFGEVLVNAQGEDVVAGIRTPEPIDSLKDSHPDVYAQFERIADLLEKHYRDIQDMEFTFEDGVVYMLQTRKGQRTAEAAVRIATEMVDEQRISREEAIGRVTPSQVEQLLSANFNPAEKEQALKDGRLLTKGLNASPGAAVGEIVLDAETAKRRATELKAEGLGKKVILVRQETAAADYSGMLASGGILTERGGMTSHAAVVARGAAIPAVVGAADLHINLAERTVKIKDQTLHEGDVISFDGSTGEVIKGELTTIEPQGLSETAGLSEILNWADDKARLEVWANADTPADAKKAREYGAKGIGLCRTEHMFNDENRLPLVQKMIMAAPDAKRYKELFEAGTPANSMLELAEKRVEYEEALYELGKFQKEDFKGILQAMDGLPVTIRLLDPPLHEFLPNHTDLAVEVALAKERNVPEEELQEKEKTLATVEKLKEQDPMMGLRGVRLGVMYPEIYQMQVKAILEAAAELKKEGKEPKPKIMIPLVSFADELRHMKGILQESATQTLGEQGVPVDYQFGVMIETPRAAVTADEIAEIADFFSFGTNDLTQMTAGISRDDADREVLPEYVTQGIIKESPFASLDTKGVGKLVKGAVADGRSIKTELSIGICGEHGGEPASIAFFGEAGLDYVSASPQRIPVARLAAAQAVIAQSESIR